MNEVFWQNVEQYMPIVRSDFITAPYAEPLTKTISRYKRIDVDYRFSEFERLPSRDMLNAFKLFYNELIGTSVEIKETSYQVMDWSIRIPRERGSIRFGVDAHKTYIYFQYGGEDGDAETLVDLFIEYLTDNGRLLKERE